MLCGHWSQGPADWLWQQIPMRHRAYKVCTLLHTGSMIHDDGCVAVAIRCGLHWCVWVAVAPRTTRFYLLLMPNVAGRHVCSSVRCTIALLRVKLMSVSNDVSYEGNGKNGHAGSSLGLRRFGGRDRTRVGRLIRKAINGMILKMGWKSSGVCETLKLSWWNGGKVFIQASD